MCDIPMDTMSLDRFYGGESCPGGGELYCYTGHCRQKKNSGKTRGGGGGCHEPCLCEALLVNDKDGHEEAPTSQAAKSQRHRYHRRKPRVLEIVGLPWDVGAHEVARIHKCVYIY